MENINIVINKATRKVNLSKSVIGNDGENLQGKLVFSFNDEFVNGTARLEIKKTDNTTSYIMLTKVDNTYELPIKSMITKTGKLDMQLVITEGTDSEEIPIFKSNTFYVIVNASINAEIEEEPTYNQWVDVANSKLNEIDDAIEEVSNLDITASKSGTTTTITFTDKDGETSSISILDGIAGSDGQDGTDGITPTIGNNGNWYLGETDTGKPSQGIQGEPGAPGVPGNNGVDGVSPTVTTSKSGGVTTVTITDKNGDHTATINDGTNGSDGVDGFSPSANVTQSGDITTISITDKEGTTTASIDLSNIGEKGNYRLLGNYTDYDTTEKAINMNELEKDVMYVIGNNDDYSLVNRKVYLKATTTINNNEQTFTFYINSNKYAISNCIYIKKIAEIPTTWTQNIDILKIWFDEIDGGDIAKAYFTYTLTNSNIVGSRQTKYVLTGITNSNQSFAGIKTFSEIPKVYSYTAPTIDTQLTPKKYVDDKIGDINAILATLTTPGGE